MCSVHIKAPCSLATISLSQLDFPANMFCILCSVFSAALLLTAFPSHGLFEKASREGTQVIGDFSIRHSIVHSCRGHETAPVKNHNFG